MEEELHKPDRIKITSYENKLRNKGTVFYVHKEDTKHRRDVADQMERRIKKRLRKN